MGTPALGDNWRAARNGPVSTWNRTVPVPDASVRPLVISLVVMLLKNGLSHSELDSIAGL